MTDVSEDGGEGRHKDMTERGQRNNGSAGHTDWAPIDNEGTPEGSGAVTRPCCELVGLLITQ